jgi:hypothetical protein
VYYFGNFKGTVAYLKLEFKVNMPHINQKIASFSQVCLKNLDVNGAIKSAKSCA